MNDENEGYWTPFLSHPKRNQKRNQGQTTVSGLDRQIELIGILRSLFRPARFAPP